RSMPERSEEYLPASSMEHRKMVSRCKGGCKTRAILLVASHNGWMLGDERLYNDGMTFTLKPEVEEQVRRLAEQRSEDVQTIVSEAVRQYIEAQSITDLNSSDVGAAQVALSSEIRRLKS